MQLTRVPWHATAQFRLPVETWRTAVGATAGSCACRGDTFEALRALPAASAACRRSTPPWPTC